MTTTEQLKQVKACAFGPATLDASKKQSLLFAMANCLRQDTDVILAANRVDMEAARDSVSSVMLDRLLLTPERIEGMAKGIDDIAVLDDPCGRVLSETVRPNGLHIKKVSVPFGVIAIIYESRPNVTSDAAALCIKSGNACVLRSGKAAHSTAKAITDSLRRGLATPGLDGNPDWICLIEDTSRESAEQLMTARGYVDLLIPRGGAGLIASCVNNATVPVIQTGTGICHIYVDKDADLEKAAAILVNAKTSRPSVCNAAEACLVHRDVAKRFLPVLKEKLCLERENAGKTPVTLKLSSECLSVIDGTPAQDSDFDTEFLDYILAVRTVSSVEEAVSHIRCHSTGHSDAIITENAQTAEYFCRMVDSAAVYVNASTRFTDGGEFGFGCEMGISTQKLHARGPMGIAELNTYKYIITGNGQVR